MRLDVNVCFIVLTVSSRKGNLLLTEKKNIVVTLFEITIYKVKLIFPESNDQSTYFNPFGFEIERNDK